MSNSVSNVDQLTGKFHAHITINHDSEQFHCPKGWKITIILLNKDDRNQKDVMITRHFLLGSTKHQSLDSILFDIQAAECELSEHGYTVVRSKLEHESLPTLEPTQQFYRECHIKIRVPHGTTMRYGAPLVASSNPMETHSGHDIVFLNARFYQGSVGEVDACIDNLVERFQTDNQNCSIIQVKKESTIVDSNLELDSWWA